MIYRKKKQNKLLTINTTEGHMMDKIELKSGIFD